MPSYEINVVERTVLLLWEDKKSNLPFERFENAQYNEIEMAGRKERAQEGSEYDQVFLIARDELIEKGLISEELYPPDSLYWKPGYQESDKCKKCGYVRLKCTFMANQIQRIVMSYGRCFRCHPLTTYG